MRKIESYICVAVCVCGFLGIYTALDAEGGEGWHEVTASREGLVGETTASGYEIRAESIFVALPHRSALGRWVMVRYGDTVVVCKVRDVGPWSIRDDYWNHDRGPLAEEGRRVPERWGKARNPAGIDLSDGLWDVIGAERGAGLIQVRWRFVYEEEGDE